MRTYEANNNKNGASAADPSDDKTLEALFDQDVTTPGFIRLPVCSAEKAHKAWEQPKPDTSNPNYPCVDLPLPDLCGDSTFVDQTSGASPKSSDCLQIAKNIGKGGTWDVEAIVSNHHQLLQYGTCVFGVEAMGVTGNVQVFLGAQDIIDVITDAVDKFGGSGKIGAKGKMKCNGNIKRQEIEWGLYHDD